MPFPDDFESECLYARDAWFLHDVEAIDVAGSRVVGVLDTTRIGAIVDAQKTWPGHDKHVPGAVVVQITATLAQLHAVYVLNMRATEGWVGFGTHIKSARFGRLGRIGPPVRAEIRSTRVRAIRGTTFIDYTFRYEQDGQAIYESEQVAAWVRSTHRGPLATP